jgi:DNA-binding transcriptional ArsR family regulator
VHGDADIASIGALVADRGRARILLALGDARALPASVLADEAGVAASTASAHLSRLVKGRMLRVKRHGRHRYFRLAGPEVGHLAGSLGAAIAARMIELGWVRRAQRSRAVHVSHNGYEGLRDQFGIELSAR